MSFAGALDERFSSFARPMSAPAHDDFSSADTKSDVRAALIGCTRLALEPTADCTRRWSGGSRAIDPYRNAMLRSESHLVGP